MSKGYFQPEDLKKFKDITDFQEVMGKKFLTTIHPYLKKVH